jgi:hypothetical protein
MSSERRDIDPPSPASTVRGWSFSKRDLKPILAAAEALLPTVCRVAAWDINGHLGGLGTEILARRHEQLVALEAAIANAGLLEQRLWEVEDAGPFDAALRLRDLVRAYRRGYLGSDIQVVTDGGEILADGQAEPWTLDSLARRLTVCVDEMRDAVAPDRASAPEERDQTDEDRVRAYLDGHGAMAV